MEINNHKPYSRCLRVYCKRLGRGMPNCVQIELDGIQLLVGATTYE